MTRVQRSVIRSSFCCFRGVSRQAEQRLWNQGCLSWRDFLKGSRPWFSQRKHLDVSRQIEEAEIALNEGLADYFLKRLPGVHKARVYFENMNSAGFVDVETTGLASTDVLTVIGVYDSREFRTYVRNLKLASFLCELNPDTLLITFNGNCFDLPVLRRHFQIELSNPHLDLLPLVRAMGCHGTLKDCERQLGISRNYRHIDGQRAAELWRQFEQRGDKACLDQLIDYNREDVLSLDSIVRKAFAYSVSSFPAPDFFSLDKRKELVVPPNNQNTISSGVSG